MFCLAQGLRGSARAGWAASAGVAVGVMAHVALAALGLGALVAAHPAAFDVIRWAGRFVWDGSHWTSTQPISTFSSRNPLSTWGQMLSYSRSLSSKAQNVTSLHFFRRPY